MYTNLRLMKDDSERREQELWQSDRVLAAEAVIGPIALSKVESVQRQDDLRVGLLDAEVRFSRRSMQKIVEELIDNALKFSKPGTPIHVTTDINNCQWSLSITDRGRGMAAEQIANIGVFIGIPRCAL
ncbi:MAG: hypothetical protein GY801_38510 [bacterium]|nr:hypothetical protein [bacterium]